MERKQQLQAAIKREADLIDQYKVGHPCLVIEQCSQLLFTYMYICVGRAKEIFEE